MTSRSDLARDLHQCGVPGDLEAIADYLLSRGWERAAPESPLQPTLQQVTRDDAPGAVQLGIQSFTHDGVPVIGNLARTRAQRIAARTLS